jgi:superfamily II DNA or RNA helicase
MRLEYLTDCEKIKLYPDEKYEYLALKKWFARRPDGYMFDPRFKILKVWDGFNHGFDKETDTIHMGLWREVLKMCQEFGYEFNFINKDKFPINRDIKKSEAIKWMSEFIEGNSYLQSKNIKERDYQLRVAAAVLKDRYCNISVATSGGKTFIYSLIVFYLMKHGHKNKKFLLVVPSKTLVTQFYNDLLAYSDNQFNLNIQEIYGEKPRITDSNREPNIVIGTFQSLADKAKYPTKWFKQFYSITCDEGHKSKNASYKSILKSTFNNAYYRWGMSGSFFKDDSEEMMQIMKYTGPVIEVVKAKELMDAGYITKVKIKGILMSHNDYEFTEQLEQVAKRDKKSCYDLECAKIQESEERLGVINKIVTNCKSNTLVLFHNIEYGQKILEHLTKRNPDKVFHYIDGSIKNNATKKNIENNRSFIKEDMEHTDKVRVLIASFATLGTGVSIDAINNVIFTQSFKKPQIIIQSIGRSLRLHKDKKMAYIFDMVDKFNMDFDNKKNKWSKFKNILWSHWEQRVKIYQEEEYPFDYIELDLKE